MATGNFPSTQAYGIGNALSKLFPKPIIAVRNPTTSDRAQALGQVWVNKSSDAYWVATSVANNATVWQAQQTGSGTFASVTVTGAAGDVLTVPNGGDVNFGNDLAVGGNTTMTGDLTVSGTTTLNGDIDITTAQAFDITATGNQDPAILLRTNGGTSETIQFTNIQGTAVDSIDLNSAAGGILLETVASSDNDSINLLSNAGGIEVTAALSIALDASEAVADSIVLNSQAGGIDLVAAGGAGLDIDLTNTAGSINLDAGESISSAVVINASGAAGGVQVQAGSSGILIGNQADCAVIDVGDVVPTSVRTITVGGGTVATAIADTIDIGPDGADTDAGASKVVTVNNGGVTLGTLTTNIGSGAITSGTHTVNIQSGNAAAGTVATNISTGTGTKTVNAGNADGDTTFNIEGDVNINPNADGNVTINSATLGDVTIGNSSAGAVDIQSGAASNFTVTGAGIDLTLDSAAGRVIVNGEEAAANAITLLSAAGGIDADAALQINIASSQAAADAIVIDASDAGGGVQISAGTGSISLAASGAVDIEPDTGTAAAASQTLNALVGVATYTGLTTAMGASATLTLSNSAITATTGVICQVSNLNASTNGAFLTIDGITQAAGSIVVSYTNNGAGALGAGDNVLLSFIVLTP